MGSVIDIAASVLTQATQRVESAAQNISNLTTPGYRRLVSFSSVLGPDRTADRPDTQVDFTPGRQVTTGNPFDLAIEGDGFFVVAGASGDLYTRDGQFRLDANGRLVNAQGFALQAEGGGDLVIRSDKPVKILDDGTVLEDGQPTGKVSVVSLTEPGAAAYVAGGMLTAPAASAVSVDTVRIRQGAYETSNVSMGDEMIQIMGALRQAKSAQRLVTTYDDLIARVLETFGQAGAA